MTIQEKKQIIRVCGKDYEETDVPTFIRNREKELAIEDLIHERDCLEDYPLGGMVERYDIEREKNL